MAKNINFSGRLAIVTGGGSGIGEVICQLLSELGASVVVADINKQHADNTLTSLSGDKQSHLSVYCDVSKSSDVTSLFDQIFSHYGPSKTADVLVNNAGISLRGFRNPGLLTCTEEQWDKIMAVNVKGMFLMSQIFIQKLVDVAQSKEEQKLKATIVNISSTRGYGSYANVPEYNTSKGAVLALTKSIAMEWSPKGIRCNAVLPGLTDTPLVRNYATEEQMQQIASVHIPMGRPGKPEEIARAVAFLASDFSSFMTGSFLQVSGGEKM